MTKLSEVARIKLVENRKEKETDKLPTPAPKLGSFDLPDLPKLNLTIPDEQSIEEAREKVVGGRTFVANYIADAVNKLRHAQKIHGDDIFGEAAGVDLKRVNEAITQSLNVPPLFRAQAVMAYAKKLVDTCDSEDEKMVDDTIKRLLEVGFIEKDNRLGPKRFEVFKKMYVLGGEYYAREEAAEVIERLRILAKRADAASKHFRKAVFSELESQLGDKGIELEKFKAGYEGRIILFVPPHELARKGERAGYCPGGSVLFESVNGQALVVTGSGRLREQAAIVAKSGAFIPADQIFAGRLSFSKSEMAEVRDNIGFCYTIKDWLKHAIEDYEFKTEKKRREEAEKAAIEAKRAELERLAKLTEEQFFGDEKKGGILLVDLGRYNLRGGAESDSMVPFHNCFFAVKRHWTKKGKAKLEDISVTGYSPELAKYLDRFTEPQAVTDGDYTSLGVLEIFLMEARKRWERKRPLAQPTVTEPSFEKALETGESEIPETAI